MGLISRVSSRTYRMSGRFVHGGIQQGDGNSIKTESYDGSESYQQKLADASDKLSSKTTEDILKGATDFREKQRDKYNKMYGYDESDLRNKLKRKRDRELESDENKGSPDYTESDNDSDE